MNCEWDEDKNAQNISKHGLNFADIQESSPARCWLIWIPEKIMVKIE